jgi:hypothetical protein
MMVKHALDFPLHLSHLFQSHWVWTFPLGGLLLCLRVITINSALITSENPGQEGCSVTKCDAHLPFLCRIYCKIASSQIHNSKLKDVKNKHIHPATWNFVYWLPRYASTIIHIVYHMYIWQHPRRVYRANITQTATKR